MSEDECIYECAAVRVDDDQPIAGLVAVTRASCGRMWSDHLEWYRRRSILHNNNPRTAEAPHAQAVPILSD